MLTLGVLGAVDLRRDGVPVRVPGGKTAELLVRLALEAGVPVRAERLLEDLWPSADGAAAPNTLQVKVSRLRRTLAADGVLRGDAAGYTLVVDAQQVDALRVLRAGDDVAAARAVGDPATVDALCGEALALFQGDVLPAAGDAAWVAPYRLRLESTRLRLLEDRLEARVELGAGAHVVTELEDLVAAHPLREGLWVLLVTALYRAGRQGDALAACTRARRRLVEELGVDPGPALARLEAQVLRHDPDLLQPRHPAAHGSAAPHDAPRQAPSTPTAPATPNAPAAPAASTTPARPGNVVVPADRLVGRDAVLDDLAGALREHRIVTVTGPAGVGKTRVALEAAARCQPDGGAWVADLATATDASSLWYALGEALGLDAPNRATVTARLAGADLLLVLDGCEHLTGAVADAVDGLARAAPRLRVLATSQQPLRARAEHVVVLEPLGLADSAALFHARAAPQRHVADDADSRATVAAVCRSLDGLPLAIELAAARTRVLSVGEIAQRLDDRFALLRDPTSRRPPRHSALRAALEWSYDLLFPDDQRGLWALAAFSGGARLTAVEQVLTTLGVPVDATLDVVSRLVERSLAVADVPDRGPSRYTLLDSVRALASERAREEGVGHAVAAAHARWVADVADRARDGVRGPAQPEHVELARAERANVDTALAWCAAHDPQLGLRIVLGLGWSWIVLGAGVEAADRIRAVLAAAGAAASADDRAAALTLCGWFEAAGGRLGRAVADLDEACTIGDERARAVARLHLGFVHTQGGRPREALDVLVPCRGTLAELGMAWEEGAAWLLTAWAAIATGDVSTGRAACDRASALLRPLGDRWALAHAEALLGELAQAEHRFADATSHLADAASATESLGFVAATAHHLVTLGRAQQLAGEPAAGCASLEQAIELGQRCGDLRTAALARARLALLLRSQGESPRAADVAGQAAAWFAGADRGDGALLAEHVLVAARGDSAETGTERAAAVEEHRRVLGVARSDGDPLVELLALDALAVLAHADGRPDEARSLLAEADGVVAVASWLPPGERGEAERLRARLGSLARD